MVYVKIGENEKKNARNFECLCVVSTYKTLITCATQPTPLETEASTGSKTAFEPGEEMIWCTCTILHHWNRIIQSNIQKPKIANETEKQQQQQRQQFNVSLNI